MTKPRRLFASLAFTAAIVLLCAIILESGSVVYYRLAHGRFLTNAELLLLEPGSFVRKDVTDGCSYADSLFPHPYLVWVRHANPPCGWDKISKQGFYGPNLAFVKDPGVYRIMLTGGSVAVQMGFVPAANSLEAVLNHRYGRPDLRFEVINTAIEAWKQPQQLISAIMYGGSMDGIISLEGFNEYLAIMEHSEHARRMDIPWRQSYLATNPYFEETAPSHVASWTNQRLYKFSRDHWLGAHSKFLLLATQVARAKVADWASSQQSDQALPTNLESLFEITGQDAAFSAQWNLNLYKRYLQLMTAVANNSGTELAIFIQPSPAVFRTLTPHEIQVVGDVSYGPHYQQLENELLQLNDVPVYSLLGIYADEQGDIYSDPIHQPVDGPGYPIMINRIADVLGSQWRLDPASSKP